MSNSDFYNKWQEDKNFIIDNDKLKDRRFVFSSLPKCNNYGFQNGKIRPLIYGDIIARFNRLLNRNVLFPVGINTLSQQSFLESRKQYNMLNDELSDLYIKEMLELGIGINDKKIMNMRHDEYLTNLQLAFIELYERGYIEYKKAPVYLDKNNNKIFDKIMFKENYQKNNMKVFVLKLRNVIYDIVDNINSLNVSNELKEMLINSFEPIDVLNINLKTTCGIDLNIEMEEPELLGGISFIFINPNYMDINPYLSKEEVTNVMKFLDDDKKLFAYTGNNAINILTGQEIPIFVSNLHQTAIYLGIPEIDDEDYQLALNEGLDIIEIVENNVLINSDFLSGATLDEAKDIISHALIDNGIAKEKIKYNHTEIVISQLDPFGALFPFLDDRGKLYSLKDFLPFNFSVQFRPTLDSKTDVPGRQIEGTMSNLFTVGMAPIISILYDEIGSSASMFSIEANQEFNSWGTICQLFVDDEKIYSELLMPIILSNIIKYEQKDIPTLIKNVTLVSKTIDDKGLRLKRKNNNLINLDQLFTSFNPDSIRLYISSTKPDEEMVFDNDKIRIADQYMRKLKIYLNNMEFVSANNLDFQFQEFTSLSYKYLDGSQILNFYNLLISFTNKVILKNVLTEKQLLNYLRIIYVIFPYLSEYLYKEIFKSKYSIINEGWPN